MKERILKDKAGRTIGKIRDTGRDIYEGYDRAGRRVGKYDRNKDKTYDKAGRDIGKGDWLLSLIEESND